ncbi:UNVERIFIED_CONTAM: Raucaffricine-O-beta-D-glucosidase [Sesamum calycinum]|uniref:Raucaffricine-O-beta-D-glucosidase n=1 Tax=Sesamum calycinum TaxID=2727403 RepID=A0AAW2NGF7_9LAMI
MQATNISVHSTSTENRQDNSSLTRKDFGDGFLFGVGTSAYQEDIKLMKQIGFDSYRFSISWPRILPGGRCSAGINKEGIDYYNDVIDTVIAHGMIPFVTLFHWDLPNCLQLGYGGMLSDKIVNDFVEYAELCFQEFGDRVKFWATINEPWTYAVRGYTSGDHFTRDKSTGSDSTYHQLSAERVRTHISPYRQSKRVGRFDFRTQTINNAWFPVNNPDKDSYTVARNLLLCHSAAVKSYRTDFKIYQEGQIGIVLNTCNHYLFDNTSDKDKEAAKRATDFMIGWFLEPVIHGQYPESMLQYAESNIVPFSNEEKEELAKSVDWVGLNYYTSYFVAYEQNPPGVGYPADQQIMFSYMDKAGKPVGQPSALSWIVPDHMMYLHEKYKKDLPPLYITENGLGDDNDCNLTAKQACIDTERVRYHQDHLASVLKAMHMNDDPSKPLRMDVRVILLGHIVIILNGRKDTQKDLTSVGRESVYLSLSESGEENLADILESQDPLLNLMWLWSLIPSSVPTSFGLADRLHDVVHTVDQLLYNGYENHSWCGLRRLIIS